MTIQKRTRWTGVRVVAVLAVAALAFGVFPLAGMAGGDNQPGDLVRWSPDFAPGQVLTVWFDLPVGEGWPTGCDAHEPIPGSWSLDEWNSIQVTPRYPGGAAPIATGRFVAGTLQGTVTIPSDAAPGAYTVGLHCGQLDTNSLFNNGAWLVSPEPTTITVDADGGSSVTVNGASFDPNRDVTIEIASSYESNWTMLGTARSSSYGVFSATYTVPCTVGNGPQLIIATAGSRYLAPVTVSGCSSGGESTPGSGTSVEVAGASVTAGGAPTTAGSATRAVSSQPSQTG